ncbi:MAG TPA: hypothetical protein VFQ35_08435 [Polyangiaceae bacterium]|nr:hypothetical protein [Polyangiaceae bacterium]
MRSGRWALLLVTGLSGCARTRAVVFQGHESAARVSPEQVVEASVMPRSATWLGRVAARCQPFEPKQSFEDRPLFDLDCSEARLRSLLREGAAEAGGNLIAEVVCNSGSSRECRALVATLPAALAGLPIEPPLRAAVGNARVAFLLESRDAPPPARPSAVVSEQPLPLPSHTPFGCVRVRCEDCSEVDARDALHVAAARLGAADLVGPHCRTFADHSECAGELVRTERAD